MMARAADYVLRGARVLERRRFEYLFGEGTAQDVVTALLPYRNPDGGFGNALEPDCRAPGSQPVTTLAALSVLDEVGAVHTDLGRGILDYLVSVTAADGGLPFVHPSARDHPRAPWWEISEPGTGSLVPTANILGLLYGNEVDHPWLAGADTFCRRHVDALDDTHPYEVAACLALLEHHPDRAWATATADRLGETVRTRQLVRLTGEESTPDGYTAGELHYPHDYVPTPKSLAAQWFSPAELASSLDSLVAEQTPDGGWLPRWKHWTPAIVFEWGGWLTVEALTTLRAHGRLG